MHIASDGDDDEYISSLIDTSGWPQATVSNAGGRGYGHNYNLATQLIHNLPGVKYVLPLEDDWELVREFDVSPVLACLDDGVFGCVRMGYIGYTQPLLCSFRAHGGHHWLHLLPESPEPHVFAGHPRIETVQWEKEVGPWTEGLLPGQTEFDVTHREAARERVGWPISLIPPEGGLFAHIGTERSY